MKKLFCEVLFQYYPRISEYEDLHSSFIANCVFNSFLCYTAILLNIVTIHAIRNTSSLPKTLRTLLLSLALSDVGVGLLTQPFYVSLLVKWLQQNDPGCNTYKIFNIITYFFSIASFFGVVAVSVDRLLAIHLRLKYQELVTHKRVVAFGNFFMGVWCISLPVNVMASVRCSLTYNIYCWSIWSSSYDTGLHQDLFSRTKPQESDSGLTSTPSSTD